MSSVEQKKAPTKQQRAAAKKKKKQQKMILLVVEIVVLLILAIVLFVWLKFSKIERDNSFSRGNINVNEDIPEQSVEIMQGYTTVAIFGLDNRSTGNLSSGNSDVIMIASINNDTHEVRLVSVYRDTYLDTGSGKFRKCNAAYASGGPEQAINMLNANLDLDITDYVTVDFNSVVEIVDAVGGVEVEVTDQEAAYMNGLEPGTGYINEVAEVSGKMDEAILLDGAGTYTLNGVQACAYARIRYTAGSDFKRTERQRLILSKVVEKAQKSDLSTVNKIIDEVFDSVKTSYSLSELLSLASQMFNYKIGETEGFPFLKNTVTLGSKGDVVVPCTLESNVDQLHEFLFDDVDYEPSTTVKANSQVIVTDTGWGEGDGY
ncbi:MAG: LCP family protein [Roseburia sp.]